MTQPQEQEQTPPNFQRVAVNLQQRFAEKVANYEGEIALLQDSYETRIEALESEIKSLKAQGETVPKEK